MSSSVLSLTDVSYSLADGRSLFTDLSLSIQSKIIGIVGRNGIGKSILGQLMAGKISPTQGRVYAQGQRVYVPQQWPGQPGDRVARVLGIEQALAAIARIEQGSIAPEDYALAESCWDWRSRLSKLSQLLGFGFPVELAHSVGDYSGGQQLGLLLLAALWSEPDTLILDEPGNHLDDAARRRLVDWMLAAPQHIVLISHDAQLLQHVQEIWELTDAGVFHYSGNYTFFRQQRQHRLQSTQQSLQQLRKQQQKLEAGLQQNREKQQQRLSQGKRQQLARGLSKIEVSAAKERSSASLARQRQQEMQSRTQIAVQIKQAQEMLEHQLPVGFSLPECELSPTKQVLSLQDLQWGYDYALQPPLSLSIKGPQRLHVHGENGSGKSTLLKTIAGQLAPLSGSCQCGVIMAYLDQHQYFMHEQASAIEEFQRLCPGLPLQQYHDRLAWLGLRATQALQPLANLSGGNRMKLAIAIALLGKQAPQLLLLDEPANHLDLDARAALLQVLEAYSGALILVSHDEEFVSAVKCDESILLA